MEIFLTKIAGQTVVIRNKVSFQRKLQKFVTDGPSKLNVVSDFDYTMSKFTMDNGERGFSCHRVIEECGLLGSSYESQAMALQQKYYPIELDPSIPHDEKVGHMLAWVTAAHSLLLASNLSQRELKQAVGKAVCDRKLKLRDGVDAFMDQLAANEVPMLVFSAGIADILEEVLLLETGRTQPYPNVYVVSNHMVFGEKLVADANVAEDTSGTSDEVVKDCLVGFSQPEFHVLNKRAAEVTVEGHSHSSYFRRPEYITRSNLLLLGDSLGDCLMHRGLHHDDNDIIKIGYLNARPERLTQFLDEGHFDIAILGDPGFHVPLQILASVVLKTMSGDLKVFE